MNLKPEDSIVKNKGGRPSLVQERDIREKLQKFLPNIIAYYEAVFADTTKASWDLKEKVSRQILNKMVSDVKPDETELMERLDRLEAMLEARQ